jgi:signal recognition particle GTPase
VDATARVATSASQSAVYAADTAERAAVVAAPKQRPSLLDQAESWGVSAWGEVLKRAWEVDARVHARTGLQVAKKVDAAP